MASRKPLVLNAGKIEQIQSGDTLDATISSHEDIVLTVGAGDWVIGNPVYISAADTAIKAKADAAATAKVIGIATESASAAATGTIRIDGIVTLTTEQWDAIAGTTGGLTAGTDYFLSEATAGLLTGTAPTTGYVTRVGRAISTTDLSIDITDPIKL